MPAPNDLKKFLQKSYRDGFLQTQIRGGIAYQVQALRQKFKLNQKDFAARTGKKQSSISRLENTEYGKVTVQTLLDIACSLDIALVVRFVSYPEFLAQTQNMSVAALQPPTIFETIELTNKLRTEYSQSSTMQLPADANSAPKDSALSHALATAYQAHSRGIPAISQKAEATTTTPQSAIKQMAYARAVT